MESKKLNKTAYKEHLKEQGLSTEEINIVIERVFK